MCAFNITLSGSNHGARCEQLVVGYALRISTDYLLSKAFTIKYYAPPLASNVLHHQWPRITTVDNSRRILILISLCSSMLQPSLNFLKNRWRPKGNVSLSSIYYLFDFSSLVAMAEEAHRLYRQLRRPLGGIPNRKSNDSLSKITATSPFLPTHTIRRLC